MEGSKSLEGTLVISPNKFRMYGDPLTAICLPSSSICIYMYIGIRHLGVQTAKGKHSDSRFVPEDLFLAPKFFHMVEVL